MHRNIQAGMRARTELVEAFKLSKSKEVKQLEAMKAEYNTLDKMLFKMMLFLQARQKTAPRYGSQCMTLT